MIGRNADLLLEEENPFRIFVCADMDAKIQRCVKRADEGENLSSKEIESLIRRIDKNRAHYRDLLTGSKWGDPHEFHMTVNTNAWDIKALTAAVAASALFWFDHQGK